MSRWLWLFCVLLLSAQTIRPRVFRNAGAERVSRVQLPATGGGAGGGGGGSSGCPTCLDSLYSYYAFENDLTDAVGSIDGSAVAPAYSAGLIGQAASIANTNQRIDFSFQDLQSVSGTSSFSIAAWIYVTTLPASYGQIAGNGLGTPALYVKSDNTISYYDNANGNDHLYEDTININTWYFITITYEDTTNEWRVYQGTNFTPGTSASLKGSYGAIGGNPSFISQYTGLIDEVGFWKDRALTEEEVVLLYNDGVGLTYPFN